MTLVLSQTGQLVFLQTITNTQTLQLHLFANDWTPSKTDTISNYHEVVFPGYGPKYLLPGSWLFAIDSLTGNYVASYPQQTWAFSTSIIVYGYYITDVNNTYFILGERFATAPVTIQPTGGNVKVTARVSFSSCS